MYYWRIRLQVSREQSDKLSDLLQDYGALAVTMENAGEDAFYEAAYPRMPTWREIYATGLFAADADCPNIIAQLTGALESAIHSDTTRLADQDWERACLADVHGFQAGPGLWVVPSWEKPTDPSAVNVIIDPGLAFGTGTHATTALCMDWLARYCVEGDTVIDYGCGSGILGVTALKLGASYAWGIDVDDRALIASEHNAVRNNVAHRYASFTPDSLPAGLSADIVIANILAGVIIEFAEVLYSLMGFAGTILLTGLLQDQESEVVRAFPSTMAFRSYHRGPWSLLVGTRSQAA